MKVRLTTDLTRYAEGLVVGSEGYTIGKYDIWSRGSDRFVGVKFSGIGTFDVLWEGLEIIDEDYLKQMEIGKTEEREALKTATDVEIVVGPRGGFRHISYSYIDKSGITCHCSQGSKEAAMELIKIFSEYGIHINTHTV